MRLFHASTFTTATPYGVHAIIRRISDNHYYNPTTATFTAWSAWGDHSIVLGEIINTPGLYQSSNISTDGWVDGTYVIVFYSYGAAAVAPDASTIAKSETLEIYNGESSVISMLQRTLGLSKENMYLDQPTYNDNGRLATARVRIYSSGSFDPTTDTPIATYRVVASYVGLNLSTWKQVRVS